MIEKKKGKSQGRRERVPYLRDRGDRRPFRLLHVASPIPGPTVGLESRGGLVGGMQTARGREVGKLAASPSRRTVLGSHSWGSGAVLRDPAVPRGHRPTGNVHSTSSKSVRTCETGVSPEPLPQREEGADADAEDHWRTERVDRTMNGRDARGPSSGGAKPARSIWMDDGSPIRRYILDLLRSLDRIDRVRSGVSRFELGGWTEPR
jgi:hypothetical protein